MFYKKMRRAVILDRDGTINVGKDKGFIYRVEDFKFLPEAIRAMKDL